MREVGEKKGGDGSGWEFSWVDWANRRIYKGSWEKLDG